MLTMQELRSMSKKELLQSLKNARKELLKVRLGIAGKTLKDTSLKSKQQHEIGRIKTALREMELEEQVKEASKVK